VNIVLGASGQVGSAVVDRLRALGEPVKAVVRSGGKVFAMRGRGITATVADAFDLPALQSAFRDAHTVFVLTPETGHSDDVIGDTRKILENVKEALESGAVRRVVGLSSMGAVHAVGNLEMSHLLEHAFLGLDIQRIYIRPALYYSSWLPGLTAARAQGVLKTFYPVDLKIPIVSPLDVGKFAAEVMAKKTEQPSLFEVQGPAWASAGEVAEALAEALGRPVVAEEMPRAEWAAHLAQLGFTEDATRCFVQMTELVRDGKAGPTGASGGAAQVTLDTTLQKYLADRVSRPVKP
jgi:uncharacterized protein YbjT (DUF2867 family)